MPDIWGHLSRVGPITVVQLMLLAVRHLGPLRKFYSADQRSRLGVLRRNRPELFGMVLTPFVCAEWDAPTRFEAVADHCKLVEKTGWPLDAVDHDYRCIADLSAISPGLHAEIAAPRWLAREGLLSFSLVDGKSLVFAIAFTLGEVDGRPVAYIGGLQGAAGPHALSTLRRLTKLAHGLRPRDLLIEMFRMLCGHYGVARILAVANAARVQRSRYWLARNPDPVLTNYDKAWLDRGGVPSSGGFFDLPLSVPRRAAAAIRPNKRAEYRRRYAMLDSIQADMCRTLEVGTSGV